MIKLKAKQFHDGCEFLSHLETFKQYASVPDDSRDALLSGLLRTALAKVGEFADRALIKTTYVLTTEVGEDGSVKLYMGGGTVHSVTDGNGTEMSFEQPAQGVLKVLHTGTVVVEYTTEPEEADVEMHMTTVSRYATALYDGEATETLNTILNEAL